MPRVCAPRSLLVDSVCACLSCVCVCLKGELGRAGRRQQWEKLFGPAPRPAVLHHTPSMVPQSPNPTAPTHTSSLGSPQGNAFSWLGCSAPTRLRAALPAAGRRGRGEGACSAQPRLPPASSTSSAAMQLSQEHPGVALTRGGTMGVGE